MLQLLKKYPYESILLILGGVYILAKLYIFGDIQLENYPYLHQDLWRRLSDAMFYAGNGDAAFLHPPLPSLLYLPFLAMQGRYLYFIGAIGFVVQMWCYFGIVRSITADNRAGFAAAILFFANYFMNHSFDFYGLVDGLCVTFILIAIYLWLEKRTRVTWSLGSGVFMGLAGLTQYAGVFIGPMLVLYDLLRAESFVAFMKKKHLYISAAVTSATLFLLFFIYRYIRFGSPIYSLVGHFGYVTLTIQALAVYVPYMLMFWGIPTVVLSLYGMLKARQVSPQLSRNMAVFSLLFLPYGIFFTFIYKWIDSRFVIYYSLPMYLYAGFAVSQLWQRSRKVKYSLIARSIFVIAVLCGLYYLNLSNNGKSGIIIGNQLLIELSEKSPPRLYTADKPFRPYFIALSTHNGNPTANDELTYYTRTASPLLVLPLVTEIKERDIDGSSILLDVREEPFAVSQQFSYYLGRVFSYEFDDRQQFITDVKSGEYRYLVTDYEENSANIPRNLVARYGKFFLWQL
jgi:hypothetical protein